MVALISNRDPRLSQSELDRKRALTPNAARISASSPTFRITTDEPLTLMPFEKVASPGPSVGRIEDTSKDGGAEVDCAHATMLSDSRQTDLMGIACGYSTREQANVIAGAPPRVRPM